jgi:hypothetical protein
LAGWASGFDVVRRDWDVDIFKDSAWSDAAKTQGRLDEIIAGHAGMFAAQWVSKEERFGQLTGAHQETRAVYGPWAFYIHISTSRGRAESASLVSWLPVFV